jgi:hypothetical protein
VPGLCSRTACPTTSIALLALCVGVVAGCRDPIEPLAPDDVTGTYGLASIGGQPVPLTTSTGTTRSSVITMFPNATWSIRTETQSTTPGSTPTVIDAGGTWVLDARASTVRLINTAVRGTSTSTYAVRDRGRVLATSGGSSGEYRYVKQP